MQEHVRAIWAQQSRTIAARVRAVDAAVAVATTDGPHDRRAERALLEGRRAAHMLAGSLGTFGLDGASRAAARIELDLERDGRGRQAALRASLRSALSDLHAALGDMLVR